MKYIQKATILALIGTITAATLFGCSRGKNEATNNANAQISLEEEYQDLSKETVLTVGNVKVTYDEILLYLQSFKEQYESLYGKDIWSYKIDDENNTFEQLFKEKLLEDIKYVKIVCSQAETLGIHLTEEELLDVNEQTAEFLTNLSEGQLEEYNINPEIVKKIYTENMLANKVYESLTLNVDTEVTDEEARQMKLQYLLIKTYAMDEMGNREDFTPEEKDKAKEKAEELRTKSLETEDFYAFAKENTQDEKKIEITVGRGDLEFSLGQVAFAMKAGDISQVVESKDGYYIFYCVTELDREATDEKKEALILERQEEAFQSKFDTWSENTEIKLNENIWNQVNVDGEVAK